MGIGVGVDRRRQLFGGGVFDAHVQVIAVARGQGEVGVSVHVVQAGHAECAQQIVLAGLRADQVLQVGERAHRDKTSPANRHRVGPRLARVEGVETAMVQHQVSVLADNGVGGTELVGSGHGGNLNIQDEQRSVGAGKPAPTSILVFT